MHPTVLAEKRAIAIQRITEAATALSARHDISAEIVAGLNPSGKDPQIKDLRRLEALADILERIAGTDVKVTVTVEEPVVVSSVTPPPVLPEDLPAPILEAEPVEPPKAKRSRKV